MTGGKPVEDAAMDTAEEEKEKIDFAKELTRIGWTKNDEQQSAVLTQNWIRLFKIPSNQRYALTSTSEENTFAARILKLCEDVEIDSSDFFIELAKFYHQEKLGWIDEKIKTMHTLLKDEMIKPHKFKERIPMKKYSTEEFSFFRLWEYFHDKGDGFMEKGSRPSGLLITRGNNRAITSITYKGSDELFENKARPLPAIANLPDGSILTKMEQRLNEQITNKFAMARTGDTGGTVDAALSQLDEKFIARSITLCEDIEHFRQINRIKGKGEMILQQAVYPMFALAMMAAEIDDRKIRYRAEQTVKGSFYLMDGRVKAIAQGKPDGCLLFTSGDLLSIFVLQPANNRTNSTMNGKDFAKCVIWSAFTAISLKEKEVDLSDIVVPFLIGTDVHVRLYVTCFDQNETLLVYLVNYTELLTDLETSRALLYNFIILIGNLKMKGKDINFLTTEGNLPSAGVPNAVSDRTKGKSKQKSFESNSSSEIEEGSRNNQSRKRSRHNAAASHNEKKVLMAVRSMFRTHVQITDPFPKIPNAFATEDEEYDLYQQESPYYFIVKNTFLKIWCITDKDVDEGAVESELSMYDRARRCGVSVPEVSYRFTNKVHFNGNEYQVLATECIHGNRRPRLDEIGRYSLSLISNISQLHAERIVHGDIKPANILWDGTTLWIIDFGHSQKIDEARRLVGTVGFTAPEVMDGGEANSFASDAYSVGATVKAVLTCVSEEYEEDYSGIESVIQGLMDVKEKRMSLSHAHNLLDKLVNGSLLEDIAGAKKRMECTHSSSLITA